MSSDSAGLTSKGTENTVLYGPLPVPLPPKRVSSLGTLPSKEPSLRSAVHEPCTPGSRGGVTLSSPSLQSRPSSRGRAISPLPKVGGVTLAREEAPTPPPSLTTVSSESSAGNAGIPPPLSPKPKKLPANPQRVPLTRKSCPGPPNEVNSQAHRQSDPNFQRSAREDANIPAIAPPPGRSARTRCNINTSVLNQDGSSPRIATVDAQSAHDDSLAWLIGTDAMNASPRNLSPRQTSPKKESPISITPTTSPRRSPRSDNSPSDLSWLAPIDTPQSTSPLAWLLSSPEPRPVTESVDAGSGVLLDWTSSEPQPQPPQNPQPTQPEPPLASSDGAQSPLDWLSEAPEDRKEYGPVLSSPRSDSEGNFSYNYTGTEDKWDTPAATDMDNWWDTGATPPNTDNTNKEPILDPSAFTPRALPLADSLKEAQQASKSDVRPRAAAMLQRFLSSAPTDGNEAPKFKQTDRPLSAVIDVSQELFVVHPYGPSGSLPEDDPPIRWISDDYKAYFFEHDHYVFLGENTSNNEWIVVAVLRVPRDGQLLAIKITKKDHALFRIPLRELSKVSVDFKSTFVSKNNPRDIAKRNALILHNHLAGQIPGHSLYYVHEPEISKFVAKIEEKHCQNNKSFKIGFLYSDGTEESPKGYFEHKEASQAYWTVLDLLGRKISLKGWTKYRGDIGADVEQDSYYTVWRDIEVMFHLCLWMNAEQHRRLIGNDVVFIIFNNSNKPLVPKPLDGLGTVPQVFCVVTPLPDDPDFYRIGTFTRPNIKPYDPVLCPDVAYHKSVLRDHLLSKLYNGYCEALARPPMNRLFEVPRAATIQELSVKFPKKKGKKKTKK